MVKAYLCAHSSAVFIMARIGHYAYPFEIRSRSELREMLLYNLRPTVASAPSPEWASHDKKSHHSLPRWRRLALQLTPRLPLIPLSPLAPRITRIAYLTETHKTHTWHSWDAARGIRPLPAAPTPTPTAHRGGKRSAGAVARGPWQRRSLVRESSDGPLDVCVRIVVNARREHDFAIEQQGEHEED